MEQISCLKAMLILWYSLIIVFHGFQYASHLNLCARVLNRFDVQLCLKSIKNSKRQLCSTQACVMTDGENLFVLTFQQSYSARLQALLGYWEIKS